MILIIRNPATPQQIEEMLQSLEVYIKLAVDIERGILSLINIRPRQSNSSMEILDPKRRSRVAQITRQLLGRP